MIPRRGSSSEGWLTSIVATAAVFSWIRALLNLGEAGYPGILVVCVLAGWLFHRRTSANPPPERPHLIAAAVALATGIVALILT